MHFLLRRYMHLFSIARLAISCFRACYGFTGLDSGNANVQKMPVAVFNVLRVAKGFLFFCEASLCATLVPLAFTTDASIRGRAVYASVTTP